MSRKFKTNWHKKSKNLTKNECVTSKNCKYKSSGRIKTWSDMFYKCDSSTQWAALNGACFKADIYET